MRRIASAIGIVLALTASASAQSYCQQVYDAVRRYGYAEARRYAIEHYTPQQVRYAERCLHKGGQGKVRRGRRAHRRR